jgi:arsenite methyltransferase
MPAITVFPTLLRETFSARSLPREPEPDLVMDDDAQVAAYEEAGRVDSVMSAAYLFHTARVTSHLSGVKTVLDLGCGPAVQLGQIAQLNKSVQFRGVDLSEEMLATGRDYIKELACENVELERADITNLGHIPSASVDMVMSTMAFHHLPKHSLLEASFAEIARVLKPGGSIYITDFGRLKSLKSVIFFAYANERQHPHLHTFWLDYERSLRAAFLGEELGAVATKQLGHSVKRYATFGVPILNVIETQTKGLSAEMCLHFKNSRSALPARYRRDLDDMRLFFRLAGMKGDPFSRGW